MVNEINLNGFILFIFIFYRFIFLIFYIDDLFFFFYIYIYIDIKNLNNNILTTFIHFFLANIVKFIHKITFMKKDIDNIKKKKD